MIRNSDDHSCSLPNPTKMKDRFGSRFEKVVCGVGSLNSNLAGCVKMVQPKAGYWYDRVIGLYSADSYSASTTLNGNAFSSHDIPSWVQAFESDAPFLAVDKNSTLAYLVFIFSCELQYIPNI